MCTNRDPFKISRGVRPVCFSSIRVRDVWADASRVASLAIGSICTTIFVDHFHEDVAHDGHKKIFWTTRSMSLACACSSAR